MDESNDRRERLLDPWRRQLDRVRALVRANCLLLFRNRVLQVTVRQLRQRMREMEALALTDPLTGLPNRRAIDQAVEEESSRRSRYPAPLALGLVDADHFREINRRHLHPGGDQALIGLARALANSLRKADRVGRVGGEEFLVLSPQTGLYGATALAERLHATVAQTPIHYNGEAIAVTVSIGFVVAEAGTPADFRELRHHAAAALAEAKKAGRNCAIVRVVG